MARGNIWLKGWNIWNFKPCHLPYWFFAKGYITTFFKQPFNKPNHDLIHSQIWSFRKCGRSFHCCSHGFDYFTGSRSVRWGSLIRQANVRNMADNPVAGRPLTQFFSVSSLWKIIDLPGGQINDPSSGKHYSLPFLPATPSSPSRILEGLFELTRCPSKALDSPRALPLELCTEKLGHY